MSLSGRTVSLPAVRRDSSPALPTSSVHSPQRPPADHLSPLDCTLPRDRPPRTHTQPNLIMPPLRSPSLAGSFSDRILFSNPDTFDAHSTGHLPAPSPRPNRSDLLPAHPVPPLISQQLQHQLQHQLHHHINHPALHPVCSSVQPDVSPRARYRTDTPTPTSTSTNPTTTPSTTNISSAPPLPNPAPTPHSLNSHTSSRPSTLPHSIRRPLMYFAKYGALNSWALDIFTLPHNAIRAECIDLYNILESIHARSQQVDVIELEEFYLWWAAFEVFIIEYFDFEADLLYPFAFPSNTPHDPAHPMSEALAQKQYANNVIKNSLLSRKETLLDSIRQLNGTFELRRHVDTSDVFHTILEEVNEFVPKLLEYFHTQERHLPPIVARLHPPSSREAVFRKYVQYIRRGESPHMNLVLLSRWMDTEARDKWVRTNVRGYWRLMHRRWERRSHRAHAYIAFKFHRRLQRSVRSVAASRLRRRTEFGEEIDDISFGSFPSHGGSIRSLTLAAMGGGRALYKTREQRHTEVFPEKARPR